MDASGDAPDLTSDDERAIVEFEVAAINDASSKSAELESLDEVAVEEPDPDAPPDLTSDDEREISFWHPEFVAAQIEGAEEEEEEPEDEECTSDDAEEQPADCGADEVAEQEIVDHDDSVDVDAAAAQIEGAEEEEEEPEDEECTSDDADEQPADCGADEVAELEIVDHDDSVDVDAALGEADDLASDGDDANDAVDAAVQPADEDGGEEEKEKVERGDDAAVAGQEIVEYDDSVDVDAAAAQIEGAEEEEPEDEDCTSDDAEEQPANCGADEDEYGGKEEEEKVVRGDDAAVAELVIVDHDDSGDVKDGAGDAPSAAAVAAAAAPYSTSMLMTAREVEELLLGVVAKHDVETDELQRAAAAEVDDAMAQVSFIYRYILRDSCSQFDSLPLTYLTSSCSWTTRRRK
jgi:hypothetical protein